MDISIKESEVEATTQGSVKWKGGPGHSMDYATVAGRGWTIVVEIDKEEEIALCPACWEVDEIQRGEGA